MLTASAVELGHVAQMDSRQIGLIRLAGEIASRLSDSGQSLQRMLDDSCELERYLLAKLSGQCEEKLLLIFLDGRGVVFGEEFL